jgi:anti-anti-sigma regulatory factor
MSEEARLEIRKVVEDKIIALQLNGIIDEGLNGKQLAEGLKENVIIDLSGVRRISSFGIREWLEFLKIANAKCKNIYYIKCPSRIIDQFNMVANFGGKGEILSFYAPYHCDFCDEDHSVLLDVASEHDSIKENQLSDKQCESCGEGEYLDEDPESFLSHLSSQTLPEPDAEIVAFLSHRLRYKISTGSQKLKIDIHIGDATYIRFMGDLDTSFNGRKIAEGKEGIIILDMNGVGEITDESVEIWTTMMQIMEPNVESIYLIGTTSSFIEKLLIPEAMANGKVKIVDLFLPYTCGDCNTTIDQNLNIDIHFEVLKFATAPELKCPDCSGKCNITTNETILTKLSTIAKPDFSKNLVKFVETAKIAIKQASVPLKSDADSEIKGSSLLPIITMAIVLLVVGVGGFFLYNLILKKDTLDKPTIELLKTSAKVKPAWVSKIKSITVAPDAVTVTGTTEDASTPEQGIHRATGWAIDLYVEHLATQLKAKDPVWKTIIWELYYKIREELMARYKESGNDKASREEIYRQIKVHHKAISTTFELAFGKNIQPDPANIYWEKYAKKSALGTRFFYKVWIKLEFPKSITDKMLSRFSKKETFEGVTLVKFFPGLNWAFPKTSVRPMILGISQKSKFAGVLKVGYILTKLKNQSLKEITDLRKYFPGLLESHTKKFECKLTFNFKYIETTNNDVLSDTYQYEWKCKRPKPTVKIIIKNGSNPNPGTNPGFQGNIWDDANK